MTDDNALQWKKDKPGVWFLYEGRVKIALIEQLPDGIFSSAIFDIDKSAPNCDDFDSAVSYVEDLCCSGSIEY